MINSHASLAEWLDYLENRHAEEMQLGLARIHKVAATLNLLEWDATIITVAGTNGKGSTVAALEAIYCSAGYHVASYTSPHLLRFNERIRVNHTPIADEPLCAIFALIEERRGDTHLTYFEMATLAALWYFKSICLDVIILEVGIGGRLDATNIIDADLAIITTVDLDHQAQLGATREAIGYEKAGILRKNTPYIYADNQQPTSILAHAKQLHSTQLIYSMETHSDYFQLKLGSGVTITLPLPQINIKAAAAAVMASLHFNSKFPIALIQLEAAMRNVWISGRQQVIHQDGRPTILYDVAHNPQAVALLVDIVKSYQSKGKVHAVFSGLNDKDLLGLIKPMHSLVDFWYPAVLSSKRAASEPLLRSVFNDMNDSMEICYDDPYAAYDAASNAAKPDDLIVVYGSFLTVSAVMSIQQQEELR